MSTAKAKLTRLELEVMRPLWKRGQASIRDLLEALPEKERPEYTTIQTIVYRLEAKGAVRRVGKVGNAHLFEAVIDKQSSVSSLVEELLARLGGSPEPVMSHLVETGRIGLRELKQMEELIKASRAGKKGPSDQ